MHVIRCWLHARCVRTCASVDGQLGVCINVRFERDSRFPAGTKPSCLTLGTSQMQRFIISVPVVLFGISICRYLRRGVTTSASLSTSQPSRNVAWNLHENLLSLTLKHMLAHQQDPHRRGAERASSCYSCSCIRSHSGTLQRQRFGKSLKSSSTQPIRVPCTRTNI